MSALQNTMMLMGASWCRGSAPCCTGTRGSADRYQMRVYALRVTVALEGAAQCHCGRPIDIRNGDVDRTRGGECYAPGSVVMTCRKCNNERANSPAFDAERFARDVCQASQSVAIPSRQEATREWHLSEGATPDRYALSGSRYMR